MHKNQPAITLITVYMDEHILETARKIRKEKNIPVEVKKIGNSHYL